MPLVSIIIQTFNRCSLVKRAIESSINQTYKNIEIIIADNHSEDGTKELCEEFASKDSRIRYFRHDENIGMVANGNFGLSKVEGNFYIFLNDDDWLDENYVEESVKFLNEHEDYSFCSPQTRLFKPNSDESTLMSAPDLDSDDVGERLLEYVKSQDSGMISSGLFRSSILHKMYETEEEIHQNRYNEDIIFIMKYIAIGKGKVLTNTHYNKTDLGTTMSLETTRDDIYTTKGIIYDNIPVIRARNFSSSILDDNFYKTIFDPKERKEIAEKLFYAALKYMYGNQDMHFVLSQYRDELFKFIKRHPFFFNRKDFYEKLSTLDSILFPYLRMKIKFKIYEQVRGGGKTFANDLVSIIIKTYNREKYLSKAIESAINQTYKNIEILISDNHSTDKTEEICKEYAKKDKRIKYFRREKNTGYINNSNFILKKVRGEFFVLLDDDDWLDENFVEKCMDFIKNHKDYSFVAPSTVLYDDYDSEGKELAIPNLSLDDPLDRIKEYTSHQDSSILYTGLFKSQVLNEMLETDKCFYKERYNDDIIFIMKYLLCGKSKVLQDVHTNKLNFGATMKLETSDDIYSTEGITYNNLIQKRCEIFSKSFIQDKFFSKYLSYFKRRQYKKELYNYLMAFYNQNCLGKNLFIYMWRHPLFIFRKEFYRQLNTLLKIKSK